VAGIPNTRQVVTSGYDGAVGLFDLQNGKVDVLGYHRHLVNRVVVDASGTRAATSSSDYTVQIWNLKTRQVAKVLRGHSDDVEDFVFIHDVRGASVGRDWRILTWDLNHGNILRVLEGHEKDVLSIAYYDGRLITSSDDKTLRVWDLSTGRLLKVWGPFPSETDTCDIDVERGRAVLGCDDGCIRIFDIRTGATLGEIVAHDSGIKKVAVSSKSGDIISAAYDQRVLLWDADSYQRKASLEEKPSKWERSLNWSPDGRHVFAGTFDGTVVAWEAESGRLVREVGDLERVQGNACFNEVAVANERLIVLVSDDGYIRLGHLAPGIAEWVSKVEPASGRMLMNAVTADVEYNLVASGAHNQKLHIFRKDNDRLTNEVAVHLGEGPINSIRVCHQPGFEGVLFVACYSGAIVKVTRTGQIVGKFRVHDNAVKALRLHPSRPLGVSCSADGILVSWDLEGRMLQRFIGHMAIIDDVDIDPSGEMIASTGRDFTLQVYSLDDGRLRHAVSLGRRSPKGICFVDPQTVVVTNYWGEVLKVTLPDERVLRRTIARNGLSSIVRRRDHLLATSYDGGVYLIRIADLSVAGCLRAMTQRLDGDWDD
jgi:WD40 repeat protein